MQLTQAAQVTFPSEKTHTTPVVSLFPIELPSAPKRVPSTGAVAESQNQLPAIEAGRAKIERYTRVNDEDCSSQRCKNTATVPISATTDQENLLCSNLGEKQCDHIRANVNMDNQERNTHQISLSEGHPETEHPQSVIPEKTYLVPEGNVNSSKLTLSQDPSEPSSNNTEIADGDSAMDLTLNKMNSVVKMHSPAVENLGAGDSHQNQ